MFGGCFLGFGRFARVGGWLRGLVVGGVGGFGG